MRSSVASRLARWFGVKSDRPVHIVALLPMCTSSHVTPSLSHKPAVSIFPEKTPMEPVIVPGCATIRSAGMATK